MSQKSFPLPFRYPGGKHYALKILRPFWLSFGHDEYREPFAGGGSVFFNKSKVTYNWLNDIDSELMTTYHTMQDSELRQKLINVVSNEIVKPDGRKCTHSIPGMILKLHINITISIELLLVEKMVSSAWGYRPKRSLPPERWPERIIPSGEKLENVTLTSLDFENVIIAPAFGIQVLMYVDPPYFSPPKNKHYRHGFELAEHQRLCEALKTTNHKFFLTYDDVPEVRHLYRWANIYEAKFFYRVDNSNIQNGSRRFGFELVITNYELPRQPKLL